MCEKYDVFKHKKTNESKKGCLIVFKFVVRQVTHFEWTKSQTTVFSETNIGFEVGKNWFFCLYIFDFKNHIIAVNVIFGIFLFPINQIFKQKIQKQRIAFANRWSKICQKMPTSGNLKSNVLKQKVGFWKNWEISSGTIMSTKTFLKYFFLFLDTGSFVLKQKLIYQNVSAWFRGFDAQQ